MDVSIVAECPSSTCENECDREDFASKSGCNTGETCRAIADTTTGNSASLSFSFDLTLASVDTPTGGAFSSQDFLVIPPIYEEMYSAPDANAYGGDYTKFFDSSANQVSGGTTVAFAFAPGTFDLVDDTSSSISCSCAEGSTPADIKDCVDTAQLIECETTDTSADVVLSSAASFTNLYKISVERNGDCTGNSGDTQF